jgi:hypothetical protein
MIRTLREITTLAAAGPKRQDREIEADRGKR